jgi:hypothetical protein
VRVKLNSSSIPSSRPTPGLLVAAEGRAEEVLRYLVDPHEAHLDVPPSLLVRADEVIE